MNQLTLHYLHQADRERDLAEDLRNRRMLHEAAEPAAEPAPIAPTTRPATTPRPTPVRARATGR